MTTSTKIRTIILNTGGPISMIICGICTFLIVLIILGKGLDWMFEFMEVGTEEVLNNVLHWLGTVAGISFVIFLLIIDSICLECSGVGTTWRDEKNKDALCPKCEGSGIMRFSGSYPWHQ